MKGKEGEGEAGSKRKGKRREKRKKREDREEERWKLATQMRVEHSANIGRPPQLYL